jgi:hypothetical protein
VKSKERLWGPTVRAMAEKAKPARRVADKFAREAWNVRMKGYGGPVQPSP